MKISEQQFRELLDRYLNNTASQEEREMLDRFFQSYQSGLSDPGLLQSNPRLQEEILREIHSRMGVKGKATKMIRLWVPLAAAVSLLVLAYFFLDPALFSSARQLSEGSLIEEKTLAGEKLSTRLSDGTKVHLNGDSKISYPKNFDDESREVTISGEVYFEVVKNSRPFVVYANHIRTEVLGTSFNVKSRIGSTIEITLVEGGVNVVMPSGKSAILKPNQQAVADVQSGYISTKEVDVMKFISWKDNILFFEQTTLKEAIATLESWYGVRIDINPALAECVITAKYQNEPLGNVLSSFQFLLNLQIAHQGEGHYSINGKGCK
jgi:ferric-dicitrate binding protein FerR (iron transport regulator)